MAVEVRGGAGARNRTFFVPWATVIHNFKAGYVGIPADVITGCPVSRSTGGKYLIDDDLMEEIIERCISYPRSKSRAKKSHRWNKED